MQPDAYQAPSTLITIHSVYSSDPPSPNGTSGQLASPSRLVKSMCTPSGASSRPVILALSLHVDTSGEFLIVTVDQSKPAGSVDGGGGGGGGASHATPTSVDVVSPNQSTSSCTMRQSLVYVPDIAGAFIAIVNVYCAPGATVSPSASSMRPGANGSLSSTAPSL